MIFYNENFNLESNIVRNFGFRRMSIDRLKYLFLQKGIHEIFLEMHEEIAKVFQDCYNEIIYPIFSIELSSEKTVPSFGYFGYTKSRKYNEILDFTVSPDQYPKDIYINIKFPNVNNFNYEQKFPKVHY